MTQKDKKMKEYASHVHPQTEFRAKAINRANQGIYNGKTMKYQNHRSKHLIMLPKI